MLSALARFDRLSFAAFASLDIPASSTLTQKLLEWHPEQPGLIADLEEGHYFKNEM